MLRIRLQRIGRHKRPFYRIVVIDSRKKRSGAAIEILGWYDPLKKDAPKYKIDKKRYDFWIKRGAKPTDAILKLILPIEEKKKLWPDKTAKVEAKEATSADNSESVKPEDNEVAEA